MRIHIAKILKIKHCSVLLCTIFTLIQYSLVSVYEYKVLLLNVLYLIAQKYRNLPLREYTRRKQRLIDELDCYYNTFYKTMLINILLIQYYNSSEHCYKH